jgi:hypothetical protein
MAVISRLDRKTTITSHDEWAKRVERLKPVILPILEKQPGFQGIDFEWTDDGIVETTRWDSEENCRNYVRNGAAATVATYSDGFLPSAPYPNGTWVRSNSDATG